MVTMKYSPVFVLFSISLCCGDHFICNYFENGKQLNAYYCDKNRPFPDDPPMNCSIIPRDSSISPYIANVTQWKFSKCDLDFVQKTCDRIQNLSALDVSYSGYASLNLTGRKLNYLKKFNASHNDLFEIPQQFLDKMPKVTEIDLSHNKLKRIEPNAFKNAMKLTKINLSHNNIMFIHEKSFANSTHLEYIDLSDNKVQSLDMLQNIKHLKMLILFNNPLSFDCNNFSKLDAVSVQFSWKNVKSFNTNCKSMQFQAILNGSKEGVFHKSKGILEIHCKKESMTKMESFVAGRNKVENVNDLMQCFGSAVKTLILNSNFVGELDVNTFKRFKNLESLYLKETKLSDFDFGTLKNLKKLNQLDISDNGLTHLQNASLLSNFELNVFKVSGNQLKNVTGIIEHLKPSIKTLDLSDSFVGQLQKSTFGRLKNLSELKLSNTSLSIIDINPFDRAKNLTILDIAANNLGNVNFIILLSTLNKLTRFYAVDCQIENASDVIQHLGPGLLELDLSGNRFTHDFSINTFQLLTNLESLHLNNTNLMTFDFSLLQNNVNLKVLKLPNNKLHELDLNSLPKNLRRLDLEGNDLVKLDNFYHSNDSQLEYLGISNNFFSCRYVLQLMKEWKGLKFIGDQLKQKHNEDCGREVQSADENGMSTMYIAIAVATVIGILLFAIIVSTFVCYLRCRRKTRKWDDAVLKRIRREMLTSEIFGKPVELPTDDQTYDEISLSNNDYDDPSRYETDLLPASDPDELYQNASVINTNIQRRSLTSRI